jgi:hypothetical protein
MVEWRIPREFNRVFILILTIVYMVGLILRIYIVLTANFTALYRLLLQMAPWLSAFGAVVAIGGIIVVRVTKRKPQRFQYFFALGFLTDTGLHFLMFVLASTLGIHLPRLLIFAFAAILLVPFGVSLVLQLRPGPTRAR